MTDFPIAVTNRWRNPAGSGEAKEYTEWVNIEAWGRLAETCHEYLGKGSLVYIEGRLKTDRYEDSEGEHHYFTKVIAQSVQFLSDNRDDEHLIEETNVPEEEEPELAEPTEA